MAIIRKKELKEMSYNALMEKMKEIRTELHREKGVVRTGGRSSNPGRIREMRRTIARILTYASKKKGEIGKETQKDVVSGKITEGKASVPPLKSEGGAAKDSEVESSG